MSPCEQSLLSEQAVPEEDDELELEQASAATDTKATTATASHRERIHLPMLTRSVLAAPDVMSASVKYAAPTGMELLSTLRAVSTKNHAY
jgi:hypothetical protein